MNSIKAYKILIEKVKFSPDLAQAFLDAISEEQSVATKADLKDLEIKLSDKLDSKIDSKIDGLRKTISLWMTGIALLITLLRFLPFK